MKIILCLFFFLGTSLWTADPHTSECEQSILYMLKRNEQYRLTILDNAKTETEEAEPGQMVCYGAPQGQSTWRGDRDTIKNYFASLQTLAKENDPNKNDQYQRQIKSLKTYARRYLQGEGSGEQSVARQAFLAQFTLPPRLETPHVPHQKAIPVRLFSDFDIERWSQWKVTYTAV
jgi:hypothetical protein